MSITPVDDAVVEGDRDRGLPQPRQSQRHNDHHPDTIDVTDNDTATVGITGPVGRGCRRSERRVHGDAVGKGVAKETTVAWSTPLSNRHRGCGRPGRATSGTVTFAADSAVGVHTDHQHTNRRRHRTTEAEGDLHRHPGRPWAAACRSLVTVDPAASSATATIAESDGPAKITLSGGPGVRPGGADLQPRLYSRRPGTPRSAPTR